MIESEWKGYAYHKQHCQHVLLSQVSEEQAEKISNQDYHFGGQDVGHDGSDKEAFLAFEDNSTLAAAMF